MQFGDERGKIFVGGLSWDTSHTSLLKYFSRYGEVIDCVVMKNSTTGKSRGFGFVTFKDPSCVEMVLTSGPHELDGRQIDPKACNPRSMNKGGKSTENSKRKIFIGGLPANITEEQLKDQFAKYGAVTDVTIMYDQQKQRSRGFGFLTFDTEESVDKVVQEHYVHINGKQVEVKKAEPRDMKMIADAATTIFLTNSPGSGISFFPTGIANGSSGITGLNLLPTAPAGGIASPYAALPTASGASNGSVGMSSSPVNGVAYQTWPSPSAIAPRAELALFTQNPTAAPIGPQLSSLSYNSLISPEVGTIYALNSNSLTQSPVFSPSSPFASLSSGDGGQPDKAPVGTYFTMHGGFGVASIGGIGATFGGSVIGGGSFGGIQNSSHAGFMTAPSIGRFPTNHASASPGFHPYRR